jgi:putative hemin transport protein
MSLPTSEPTSTNNVFAAWQQLRLETPHIRAREAALQLHVSEAELVASRLGTDVIRLRPEWKVLLSELGNLGRIMALTRNEHCVHERKGPYRELAVSGNSRMGLVVSPDIDLRLFLSGWAFAFAVDEVTSRGLLRSLQIFDAQGVAIHKVYLTEHSNIEAWTALKTRFKSDDQDSHLELVPLKEQPLPCADEAVDTEALRSGWAELRDTHHFHALLQRLGIARTQALRLAGTQWAEPLRSSALPRVMEAAAAQQLPIMVFVGNRHCIQIHTGAITTLKWVDTWFNVLDSDFNLHIQTSGIHTLWRVRKPSVDGVITSLEAYDNNGELIMQLFGARKPGQPELTQWTALAESAQ